MTSRAGPFAGTAATVAGARGPAAHPAAPAPRLPRSRDRRGRSVAGPCRTLLLAATLLLPAGAGPALAARTERVSIGTAGQQGPGSAFLGGVSGRGRYVAFLGGGDLAPGGSGFAQVFVRDRKTKATILASVGPSGAPADGLTDAPVMSRGGRYLAFPSGADNLVPGTSNGGFQVYRRDIVAKTTVLVSAGTRGEPSDAGEQGPAAITADGRYVVLASDATNLVPGAASTEADLYQLFVRDVAAGVTTAETKGVDGKPGNGDSTYAAITPDGRWLAFASEADNLVPGDTDGVEDVFLRDRQTGRTVLVSVARDGGPADRWSSRPAISDDGRFVAFESGADDLVAGDTTDAAGVFVRDMRTGKTERVSLPAGGGAADSYSMLPSMSADGRYVAFVSPATDLVPGDTNRRPDAFVRDRATGTTVRVDVRGNGGQARGGFDGVVQVALSADGRVAAFESDATNLVPNDTNDERDVFVHVLSPTP